MAGGEEPSLSRPSVRQGDPLRRLPEVLQPQLDEEEKGQPVGGVVLMGEVALALFIYSTALKVLVLAVAITSSRAFYFELKADDYWRRQRIINLKEVAWWTEQAK